LSGGRPEEYFWSKKDGSGRAGGAETETPKYRFGGPWVGAFSVFGAGHTETSFIFSRFWPKITKMCRFRG